MATNTKHLPDGYNTITPYLIVREAAKALDFYQRALGGRELMRMAAPNGTVMHAELQFGDSKIMLADEFPAMQALSPPTIGGTPLTILLYVEDVDAVAARALAAGAKLLQPVKNQFYGDRAGTIEDPFGHRWTLATHVEDVPPEEMRRRAEAAMSGQTPCSG